MKQQSSAEKTQSLAPIPMDILFIKMSSVAEDGEECLQTSTFRKAQGNSIFPNTARHMYVSPHSNLTACTRPVQEPARQNTSIMGKKHTQNPINSQGATGDSCWERERRLFKKGRRVQLCLTHTRTYPNTKTCWITQTELDGERRKKRSNLKVGQEGIGVLEWW